jgi:hypothetical protein
MVKKTSKQELCVGQSEHDAGAYPPACPKRSELKVSALEINVATVKSFWPELFAVVPELVVPC